MPASIPVRAGLHPCDDRKASHTLHALRRFTAGVTAIVLSAVPAMLIAGAGPPPSEPPEIPEQLTSGYTSGITAEEAREWILSLPPEERPEPTWEEIAEIRRAKFSKPIDHLREVPGDLDVTSVQFDGPTQEQRNALNQQSEAAVQNDLDIVPGFYIVGFDRAEFPYLLLGETDRNLERVDAEGYTVALRASALVQSVGGELFRVWNYSHPGFSGWLTEAAAQSVAADPQVAYVEPNRVGRWSTDQSNPPSWGLRRIHNENMPSENIYRHFFKGENVTAYVFDRGIRTTHQDLPNQGAHYDASGSQHGIDDVTNHGTGVAAIVGGTLYGVAKEATIFMVKVGDTLNEQYVIDGMDEVLEIHDTSDLAVANMSFGLTPESQAVDNLVTDFLNAGIVIATSADSAATNQSQTTPNNRDDVFTVGAVDEDGLLSDVSGSGSYVEIYAPGVDVVTASANPIQQASLLPERRLPLLKLRVSRQRGCSSILQRIPNGS